MAKMLEVVPYLALTNEEIARVLKVSEHEVKAHISSLMATMMVSNRVALAIECIKASYIKPEEFVMRERGK